LDKKVKLVKLTKQEPPQTIQQEKKLEELSVEEFSEKIASFQEALKLDKFKNIDIYEKLGLEKPSKNTDVDPKLAEDLTNKYNDIVGQMTKLGIEIPTQVKMSETERAIAERVEKHAQAKFSEQKQDVLKIDPDFPVDIIEKLKISTDDKIVMMSAFREVAERNQAAIKKVKTELDVVSSELKEVKMRAPAEEKKDRTGKEIVESKMKEWGLPIEEVKKE
jgi:hypothetical protein